MKLKPRSIAVAVLALACLVLVLGISQGWILHDGGTNPPRGTCPRERDTTALFGRSGTGAGRLRLLVAIDTSASMSQPLPRDAALARIEAAVGGVKAGLERIRQPYDLGLWTFRQCGYRVLAPIARAPSARLVKLASKLDLLPRRQSTDGGTPLYNTIAAGIGALRLAALRNPDDQGAVNALVVITDGADNPPDAIAGTAVTVAELNRTLAQNRDIAVVVTAAADDSCRVLFPSLELQEENCPIVRTSRELNIRLGQAVARLESLRGAESTVDARCLGTAGQLSTAPALRDPHRPRHASALNVDPARRLRLTRVSRR